MDTEISTCASHPIFVMLQEISFVLYFMVIIKFIDVFSLHGDESRVAVRVGFLRFLDGILLTEQPYHAPVDPIISTTSARYVPRPQAMKRQGIKCARVTVAHVAE